MRVWGPQALLLGLPWCCQLSLWRTMQEQQGQQQPLSRRLPLLALFDLLLLVGVSLLLPIVMWQARDQKIQPWV